MQVFELEVAPAYAVLLLPVPFVSCRIEVEVYSYSLLKQFEGLHTIVRAHVRHKCYVHGRVSLYRSISFS